MRRWLAMAGLLISLKLAWWNSASAMERLSEADAAAIRAAVKSQLDALMEDDAAKAFELATPMAQMQIGSPDDFLRLIKEEYAPIYRHRVVMFSQPEMIHGSAVQLVRLADGDSHVWLAVFWMEQDENRRWKIGGCQLLQTNSVSI